MLKRRDSIAGFLLIIFSSFFLYKAYLLPKSPNPRQPGPGLFPKLILFGILFGSIYLVYQDLKKNQESFTKSKLKSLDIYKTIFVLAASLVYVLLMGTLNFILITFLFLAISMQTLKSGPFPKVLMQVEKMPKIILISFLVTAGIYFIFGVFLNIPLP